MPESQMLINYVPGEECRVAIVEDGRLEELYVEKFASASRVGNIYVGKVANVEPAIQAAFVDFGVGENGFLHITDLHPRYFPGEGDDTTERVGLKTPRRERPLIQQALRRGDEVIVQVLKEGVGTKGPTLTSYLSIPGRFLVMMPYMDKVGVSRKVEDEEQRREMREILDQLELPEGFGFILRTAGMDRTKTDLKRDLAYLQRLWKDMERRKSVGGKPRMLYSESDLLVRSLRDMLTNEISEVIIDHEVAVQRAARFMKIVAPRGTTKLMHYPGKSPIFHAFNIERELALIHAREVPLPSGGRLVIDQTEALVAIDVNSGKSRESRDAETNAYQTNVEAVDEICRQLRLRDMGGIVINDLIDMRRIEHRKDIENRFKERMKRDRAKTTVLQISEFGILEMTRQRMRPSHESTHFTDCPTCRGRGLVQKPDSVAADALRDLAAVLDVQRVHKIELAVSARVAGDLLSHKRQFLGRMERHYGKHVDVRVSEALPVDRVSFYAYDDQGADIDLTNLPQPKKPKDLVEVVAPRAGGNDDDWAGDHDEERRKLLEADGVAEDDAVKEEVDVHPIEIDEGDIIDEDWPSMDGGSNKANRNDRGGQAKGKRGGRGGRGGRDGGGGGGGRDGRGGGQGGGRGDQPQQRRDDQPRQDGRSRQEPRPDSRRAEAGPPPRAEGPRPDAPPRAPELGPDGQPLPQAEGEGGRRRRRRRRRGRGRGGEAGAPVNGGQPGADGFVNDDGSFEEGPAGEAPEGDVPAGDGDDRPAPMPRRAPVAGERGFVPLAAGGNWGDDEIDPAPAATPRDSGAGRKGAAPVSRPPVAAGDGAVDGAAGAEGSEGDGDVGGEGGPVGEGGEQGEGGRRRKRRRRRRGRGSRGGEGGGEGGEGGDGGGAPAGEGGGEGGGEAGEVPVEPAAAAPAAREEQVGHQPRHQPRGEGQNRGEPRGESRGEQPRNDRREGGEQPAERQPERQPERQADRQGGRRDGRDGRSGRDGRGGGRGGRGEGRGDSDRRDRGGRGDGGGGGGGGEVAAPAPQQPRAEGGGSAPSQPAPAPKPRTLYGAIRRKLSASELNKRPKAE